jgi:hypothetical protein
MLTHAREVVEQRALACVGVSYERNFPSHASSPVSSSTRTIAASSMRKESMDVPKSTAIGPLKGALKSTRTRQPLYNPISTKRGAKLLGCISTT